MAAANSNARFTADDQRDEAAWIDFSTIENPFGTPESFTTAMSAAVNAGKLSTPPDRSALALRHALSRTLSLDEDSFLVGTTVSSMIGAVAQAFEPCTVGVMIPCPVEYVLTLSNTGHKIERIAVTGSYVTPHADAVAAQNVKLDAVILANPGYPTSRLLPESVLQSYLDTCDWVIVDERSIELTLGGKSVARYTEQYRNLVVIQSFTEQYALPGAPISYCIAHSDLLSEVKRFYDDTPISLLPEALSEPSVREHPKLDGVRGFLYSEIPWMQTMLSLVPGIEIFPAEANYVMCAFRDDDNMKLGAKDVDDLVEKLKAEKCIVKKLGEVPGLGGAGHFCVAVRTRQENERLISTLRRIMTA